MVSDLIKHFGIDWKLLLAQAVNFLILLVILKKFAYGPILSILRKRRGEIEKGLKFTKDAEERLARVDKEREEVLSKSRGEALALMRQAEGNAKMRKDEILKEAAQKGEAIVDEAKRRIEEEKAKMNEEVYHDAKGLVAGALGRVLGKMPPEERDKELIKEALTELKASLR